MVNRQFLKEKTKDELKELAENRGLSDYKSLNKDALIEKILSYQGAKGLKYENQADCHYCDSSPTRNFSLGDKQIFACEDCAQEKNLAQREEIKPTKRVVEESEEQKGRTEEELEQYREVSGF